MHALSPNDPLPHIVTQHVEEAAHLAHVRRVLSRAPHLRLNALRRADLRLAAHLDGVAVAGECGWQLCDAAVAAGDVGAAFVAGVRAIEDDHPDRIDKMLSLAQALPVARQELAEVFAWVSAQSLQGLIRRMLESSSTTARALGILACIAHRADPGKALDGALDDEDAPLRAVALRAAGEAGRLDLHALCVRACINRSSDDATGARFWAARSALLLGDRQAAPAALHDLAIAPGPRRITALTMLLKWLPSPESSALLKRVFEDPARLRDMLKGIGAAGDPRFVPWLVDRMREPGLARLAGESFAMITGCDMASADFILQSTGSEAPPPAGSDGEDHDDVESTALDEDEAQPLPDAEKVFDWWGANGHRFVPGNRYFVGAPVSAAHCHAVLSGGYQRQRIAAAEHLAFLLPGTPVFNTAAPAWRQERWLKAMEV